MRANPRPFGCGKNYLLHRNRIPFFDRSVAIGKSHANSRALVHLAGDFQFAAMGLNDMFNDCEAEPGAAKIARARLVDTIEALSQSR